MTHEMPLTSGSTAGVGSWMVFSGRTTDHSCRTRYPVIERRGAEDPLVPIGPLVLWPVGNSLGKAVREENSGLGIEQGRINPLGLPVLRDVGVAVGTRHEGIDPLFRADPLVVCLRRSGQRVSERLAC